MWSYQTLTIAQLMECLMLASGIFFIRFVHTLNSQLIQLSNDCIICLRISVLLLGGLYTNLEGFKGGRSVF